MEINFTSDVSPKLPLLYGRTSKTTVPVIFFSRRLTRLRPLIGLHCGDVEFWHQMIHYFVFPSLYLLCEALLRSNWSNEGSIFARECVCECRFCASLEQTEGRTRAKKKNTCGHTCAHAHMHTHALKPQSRSGLIKKQCSDCRDCVKERMCVHVCVALGRWLKHDRPSNETMYSAGPRGFHLSIQTATSCGFFMGKKVDN